MRFAAPTWLWLLALVPALGALYVLEARARRAALARLGDRALVARLTDDAAPGRRIWKAVLTLGGVALLALALARPQFGSTTEIAKKRGLDIVVALDFSKSMLARDTKPDRLTRAKLEISRLLTTLEGDRVGLVAFAGETDRYPLTTDYDALRLFWRDLTPDDMPVGGTALGRAITAATDLLTARRGGDAAAGAAAAAGSAAGGGGDGTGATAGMGAAAPPDPNQPDRVLILITDGEDTESEPLEAAETAAAAGIKIYTVGIGSASGGPIPLLDHGDLVGYVKEKGDDGKERPRTSHLDEDTLKKIAEKTGGKYFRSGGTSIGVEAVAEEIRGLRKVDIEQRLTRRYTERYALFLFPAFALLLTEVVLSERRRRRGAAAAAAAATTEAATAKATAKATATATAAVPAGDGRAATPGRATTRRRAA
ncbi:MAG TPA: VWA domain-containing protein [Myxococcota bacterium]|jgi:Ca-activated chloride channel family protein|nr:VWA domain-containing protein [Myxococcota bacterium]